jgi:hypothetical protein
MPDELFTGLVVMITGRHLATRTDQVDMDAADDSRTDSLTSS